MYSRMSIALTNSSKCLEFFNKTIGELLFALVGNRILAEREIQRRRMKLVCSELLENIKFMFIFLG